MDRTSEDTDAWTRREYLGAVTAVGAAPAITGCVALAPPEGESAADDTGTPNWFRDVYEASIPAVVEVATQRGGREGRGSGFRLDRSTVVTNAHVVAGNEEVAVRDRDLEWGQAAVSSEDVYADLAVLELDESASTDSGLTWAKRSPEIGTRVMALGAPLGFEGSASTGIVSGVNRSLPSQTGFSIPASIQTDAAINPGSSGGPLLNDTGGVFGVVFAGVSENVGFAISAPVCQQIVPVLADGEEYEHTFVGIAHRDVTPAIAAAHDLDPPRGIYVADVLADAPATGLLQGTQEREPHDQGLLEVGGDIILAVDEVATPTGDHLGSYLLLETRPGQTVTFTVFRDGEERAVDVTLGTRPDPDEGLPGQP